MSTTLRLLRLQSFQLETIINTLKLEKSRLGRSLTYDIDKFDELDSEYIEDQYGNQVVATNAYEMALEIERSKGYIDGINSALEYLTDLKERVRLDAIKRRK